MGKGISRNVVKTKKGEYVYIDTSDTFDAGLETMAFKCNSEGEVSDWQELNADWYKTLEEALEGHDKMVDFFKNYEGDLDDFYCFEDDDE